MEHYLADILTFLGAGSLAGSGHGEVMIAGIVFAITAVLIAFCVPGILVPLALSSGALLGAWQASLAVALGAVAGSQLLFLAARHLARDRLRKRLAGRLDIFQARFEARGLWYVIALRLAGAPQLLVAGGSALMPIRSSDFALATLVGLLPPIAIAATTGSII